MQTNSDDEGEPLSIKPLIIFLFVLFIVACKEKTNSDNRPLPTPSKDSTTKTAKTLPQTTAKKKKTIYLTFDDGPNKGSANLLNVIETDSIPATVFVVGMHVFGSRTQMETWHSMVHCSYLLICNHSFTHAHLKYSKFYKNDSLVVNDFLKCKDSLHLNNFIARTPGRNIWRWGNINSTDVAASKHAADSLHKAGFDLMGWDVEWHYNNKLQLLKSSDELIKDIDSAFVYKKTRTPDHLVLLAHDQVFEDSTDLASLKEFVKTIKLRNEYELDVVSNYPKDSIKLK